MLEILKSIDCKAIAWIIGIFAVFIILVIYRKPLKELIYKLAKTKKISKTRDGLDLEFEGEPENKVKEVSEKDKLNLEAPGNAEDDWFDYFFQKEYYKAIGALEKQKAKDKKEDVIVELECYIGLCMTRINYTDGITKFNEIKDKYPKYAEPYYWLAAQLKNGNSFKEAIAILDEGIAKVNNKPKLLKNKAKSLIDKNRLDESAKVIEIVLNEDKNDCEAYVLLAEIYSKKGDKALEEGSYRSALKANPSYEDALSKYASFLYDANRKKEALLIYKKLTGLFENNSTYFCLLGNTYLDLELNNKALDVYEKANELAQEKEGWILANIGNLYKNQGFYTKGIRSLKKAVVLEPDSEYAHNRLALSIKLRDEEDEKETKIIDEVKSII